MRNFEIICYGAMGGLCPSLAKLAGSYSANPEQAMPIIGVYVALALFAILGAIVSLGFGTQEVRAAIVAGIAAPAIVTNVLAGVENRDAETAALQSFLTQPAFAQQIATAQMLQGTVRVGQTYVTISANIVGGQTVQTPLSYQWQKNGRPIADTAGGSGTITLSGQQSILMPEGATSLEIDGRWSVGLREIIANDHLIDLTITTRPTVSGDLLWGLGGKRRFVVKNIEVSATQ